MGTVSDITLEEVFRKVSFIQQVSSDISQRYDGIGGGSDAPVTNRNGAIWFSATNKDVGWEQLREAMDEATRRLDDVGLEWSLNTEVQQRKWEGESGPYTGEIEIDNIDEEAISKYEASYVEDSLANRPRDADIYRETYNRKM
jgi:hypothetical protein